MKNELRQFVQEMAKKHEIEPSTIKIDYTENPEYGDFFTNVAMINAKKLGMSPRDLAKKIVADCKQNPPDFIEDVQLAGPGFINFFVKSKRIAQEVISISENSKNFPKPDSGKTVMVEYTDPNPFKILHIGHLMSNAIGESISRLAEYQGATIKRANWQGDVGLHVAKTIWGVISEGMDKFKNIESLDLDQKIKYLGDAYVKGNNAYEDDESAKAEITQINKKIFDKSDEAVNEIYEKGRTWSLDYFEGIYKRLGTKFDYYFFEGKEGLKGIEIVAKNLDGQIFEKSDGVIVFKGEKYGLHTRVFLNSQGLPTYETKELGLNQAKFEAEPHLDSSIIITANEQSDYFKVLLKVMELVLPNVAQKTTHISHGILRFASGKMSSRKGNVISAESLISDIKKLVQTKIADRKFTPEEQDEISEIVAVAAIKYSILRTSIGSDVIFDSAASISFEGDSGPYLQYSAVRAASVLEKASSALGTSGEEIMKSAKSNEITLPQKVGQLDRLITHVPDIAQRARNEFAPQIVTNYLIGLASTFNSFYASQTIISETDPLSPYYVALTKAFHKVMTDGLWLLGIKIPKKM